MQKCQAWEEKYISFTKEIEVNEFRGKHGKKKKVKREQRFMDSFKFMASSLGKLVKGLGKNDFRNLDLMSTCYTKKQKELLKQKGVYPYEYMDGFDKFGKASLKPKSKFFSKLNNEDISDSDNKRAQNVWNVFSMKTMRDCHDLYLKTDVLLLADVMENFRKVSKTNYGLDPLWYYTAPGLAWDSALKLTEVELELISDPDMYLFIEKGIRGGISTITKRHARANNKYTGLSKIPECVIQCLRKLDVTIRKDPKDLNEKLDAFETEVQDIMDDYDDANVEFVNQYLNKNLTKWVKGISRDG
jgi:hypothetical protein